ncbi:MAG: hypothetical protein U0836_11800 [Pirellulales bacterium]
MLDILFVQLPLESLAADKSGNVEQAAELGLNPYIALAQSIRYSITLPSVPLHARIRIGRRNKRSHRLLEQLPVRYRPLLW